MTITDKQDIQTRILHDPIENHATWPTPNPSVHHATTILFKSLAELKANQHQGLKRAHYTYALHGTSCQYTLSQTITDLENGHDTIIAPSGLMAITLTLGALLKSGDHLLVTDSVYGPVRIFCDKVLARNGIEVGYYDPRIGAGIRDFLHPNTRAVLIESPGSNTFEVQDIPAITSICKTRGVATLVDNTWATPLYLQPLALGADISIHAVTKYLSGHADVILGSISSNEEYYPAIHQYARQMGNHAAPDDCYLALRGIRTLAPRLRQHEKNAYVLAKWLESRPEVKSVIHPGLAKHPDHDVWKRDFNGASGLFAFIIHPVAEKKLAAMLDNLKLFGMGYSWGGFASLIIPSWLDKLRTVNPVRGDDILLRIHTGLENTDDLIADLEAGFKRLNEAS